MKMGCTTSPTNFAQMSTIKENIWKKRGNFSSTEIQELALPTNTTDAFAEILLQRNISTAEQAKTFLRPEINQLLDPFGLKDMDKAIARLVSAKEKNEKVLVYGDYDVDGTTAVAVFYSFLKHVGVECDFYIPDRYKEGYGFSDAGVEFAHENKFNLIITLDCGIKDGPRIEQCNEYGIDVIVCDHHTPEVLPPAFAVVNPKRKDCTYENKGLCGCAVGFKVICAWFIHHNEPLDFAYSFLDLVAVATGADIVPVTSENRVLLHFGLKEINTHFRPGIAELLTNAKYNGKNLKVVDLVFLIAPRINAAGRIFSGKRAVEVLIAENSEDAKIVAAEIEKNNRERKGLDRNITVEALDIVESDSFYRDSFTTVVKKEGWHKGVVGIVASRIIESHYKPTIVLTEEDGILSGSVRSIEGVDVYDMLAACEEHLIQFGGHSMAAGLKLKSENFFAFREAFDKVVREFTNNTRIERCHLYDTEIQFDQITFALYESLQPLEPHGPENMRPVFLSKNISNARFTKLVGAHADHLQLHVKQAGNISEMKGIAFKMKDWVFPIIEEKEIDLLFQLNENVWNGQSSIQLEVMDIRLSS
jgi:single-stranded-DNA-specific exonuclease